MSTTTLPRPHAVLPARPSAGRLRSLVRGRSQDPAWARPGLIGLLLVTALAYGWNLTASGEANSFYAAAVQAATKSWKALFFGSIDSSSFITVDKPPAALWVMALSGRLFGFSSASMLVPQVLEGVLAVALLWAGVKRWFGASAGLLAGSILAATPVAALMFRFNNPDALLTLLLVAGAYCLVRAVEDGSGRWMLGVGMLIGFAFLTKMLQAFLVVPAFALVYLMAAPVRLRRRIAHLLWGALAIVVSAGWWVAAVALWPAASRPMIDGSSKNSILDLIVGYNGLGRVFGSSGPGGSGGLGGGAAGTTGGAGGGGGPGGMFSGQTGLLRLFNDLMGGQAAWLLPAALLVIVGGLWWTRRAPRTDRTRAAIVLWGGWLVISGLVFSLGSGVIHTYYTVALAPAIAALVAIGAVTLWRRRDRVLARGLLAGGVAATAGWSIVLLQRTPSWQPWLRPLIGAAAALTVLALVVPAIWALGRRTRAVAVVAALCACLAGPLAFSAQTIASAHTGTVPSAGPATAGSGAAGGPGASGRGAAGGGGAAGGEENVSRALVTALRSDASRYRWVAATGGSQSAASLELATGGEAVMAIGGFSSEGGNLTLAQFQRYVHAGEIHFYVVSNGPGGGTGGGPGGATARVPAGATAGPGGASRPGGSTAGGFRGPAGGATGGPGAGRSTQAITTWVKAHFKSETIGGQTVYDLSQPRTG